MTTSTFVVRILDASGTLLAWRRVPALMKPGGLWLAVEPTTAFEVLTDGIPANLTVQWPDAELVRWLDIQAGPQVTARVGQVLTFHWRIGPMVVPLWQTPAPPLDERGAPPVPAVTEQEPIRLAPSTADMGAVQG